MVKLYLSRDFNVKAIETEMHSISRDGIVLLQLLENVNVVLMNTSAKCKGKWTRINPNNPKERSIIDYIITTEEINNNVESIEINASDVLKIKRKKQSDHNTITLKLNIPVRQMKTREKVKARKKSWRINKRTDWIKYKRVLEDILTNIDTAFNSSI